MRERAMLLLLQVNRERGLMLVLGLEGSHARYYVRYEELIVSDRL